MLINSDKKNWEGKNDFELTVEIKSPYFSPNAHVSIPKYYVPQLELESYSSVQKKSLHVSCSKDFSTAFLYSNNEEFTNQLLLEAKENFIESGIPKRHTESAKTLKAQLKESTDAAQFLGEFKTVCAAPKNLQHNINDHTSFSVSVCIIYIQYSIAQWQNLADQMSNIDMILYFYLSLLHGLLNCVYCDRVTEHKNEHIVKDITSFHQPCGL